MDTIKPADVAVTPKHAAPPKKAAKPEPAASPAYHADHVDAAAVDAAKSQPAALNPAQLGAIATKKATCPFIGSAVAKGELAVRNNADKPLASVADVVALGNSGGGDLGEVLELFADGNHAKMAGASGKLDADVPEGLFSLDFPGSQGSHPGHSGILQGDPAQVDTGRFSQAELDRLLARARDGHLKRSDVAAFIAENLAKDPEAKVVSARVGGLLLGDVGHVLWRLGPTVVEKVKNLFPGADDHEEARKFSEALTKTLGEDNLIGSAGEFGLLMAFLANSPRTRTIDGEPALAVEDVTAMFKEHRLPDGWETWKKTRKDWVVNTTALMLEAAKQYHRRA